MHRLPGNKTSSSLGIPKAFLQFLDERSIRIVASSNGLLLCLILPELVLFICNPATHSCFTIASPACLLLKHCYYRVLEFAFVWNHNTEEFQLIYFDKNPRQGASTEFVCKVYMPKEVVWKERGSLSMDDGESLIYGSHVFYKGNIYFASYRDNSDHTEKYHYMSSYNFETGVTKRVNFPEELAKIGYELSTYKYEICIFKWGKAGTSNAESICVVHLLGRTVFTIWVLTDLESASWSMFLSSSSLDEMGLEIDSYVDEFTIMNGDSLVIVLRSGDVYVYDLIGARGKRLEKIGELEVNEYMSLIPYSNTLRSCGAGAKGFVYET
ncbi:uncharacterized protein LOC114746604 [Neltuma alba]|nr:uncharacterized protein LOC114746604 [Prosopis alba]